MVDKEYGLFLLEKAKSSEYGALLVHKTENLIEDYYEFKFIYNTKEEQLEHKALMEDSFYECYRCGTEILYRDYDKVSNPDSTFTKYDVRIPTSVFGTKVKGLLHEARLLYGYYNKIE